MGLKLIMLSFYVKFILELLCGLEEGEFVKFLCKIGK